MFCLLQAWRRRREMLPKRSGSGSLGSSEDQSELENSTSRPLETEIQTDSYSDSAEKAILKQKKTGFLWSGYADKLKKNAMSDKTIHTTLIKNSQHHQIDGTVMKNKFSTIPDFEQETTSTQAATTTTMTTELPSSYSKDQLNDSWSLLNFLKTVVKAGG